MNKIIMRTKNGTNYFLYLPDNADKSVEIKFRLDSKMYDVKNNEVLIQLSKDMLDSDFLDAIMNTIQEVKKRGMVVQGKPTIELDNQEDYNNISRIIQRNGLDDGINITKLELSKINNMGDQDKEKFDKLMTSLITIKKNENGRIVEYYSCKGKNENQFFIGGITQEFLEKTFGEIISDPDIIKEIEGKTEDELALWFLNHVAIKYNLKKYYMLPETNVRSNDEINSVTQNVASSHDTVNEEIGIVKKDASEDYSMDYITVSQDGSQVYASETKAGSTSFQNDGTSFSSSYSEGIDIELKVVFVDSDNNIYNEEGVIIGNLNSNPGYSINESNQLCLNGNPIANVDDYRNIDKNKDKDNIKTKKLIKPEEDNSGMTKIGTICLIIGLLLSIVTYIILR